MHANTVASSCSVTLSYSLDRNQATGLELYVALPSLPERSHLQFYRKVDRRCDNSLAGQPAAEEQAAAWKYPRPPLRTRVQLKMHECIFTTAP